MILTILLGCWLLALFAQLVYIFVVYARTAWYDEEPTEPPKNRPAVTVVVVARNEQENLKELLPLLDTQDYPDYEVLVMDDRSYDGTHDYLKEEAEVFQHVRFIRIETTPEHVTPKKYALTIALKKALNPVVLLTDADCRPEGPHWISGMISHWRSSQQGIVLGFSPYFRRSGFLNFLIRSETLFTAVQYLSLALAGRPYMGVGRNLMYRRQLFFDNRGFYTHLSIMGGDDDLLMNEVANGDNTVVSLNPDTFVWSIPKETWSEWRRQKRRHLNVGRFYKPGHKWRLGLLTSSHVFSWLLGLPVGLWALWFGLTGQIDELMNPLLLAATGLFLLRLIAFWVVVGRISYRLAHTVHWSVIGFMDVMLAVYYSFMGLIVLFTKRRKIVW